MNDREIDTIDKVCVLDQRFESLDHPVQENTTRENDTSKYLKISDLGKPRQTSKNVKIPSPKILYVDINETRSQARFFLSVGDPPADPTRSQKNLKIWTCELHVLVFDTRDGAETPQNNQGKRFDRRHKQNKTTRR